MDELDRILSADEGVEPSSGFTSRVMDALEHDQPPLPIPFPWMRLAPALLGALGIVVVFAITIATGDQGPATPPDVAKWLEHPLAGPLGLSALALVGSWAVFRVTMRLAAPVR